MSHFQLIFRACIEMINHMIVQKNNKKLLQISLEFRIWMIDNYVIFIYLSPNTFFNLLVLLTI